MARLAALTAIILLVVPVSASAMTRGGVSRGRLVQLVGHRMHAHRRAAALRPSRHALFRLAPSVARPRPAAKPPTPTPSAPTSSASASASPSATERQLIDAMNTIRAQHGLRAVTASAPLSTAANVHSVEMLKRGYFEHESANGEDFSVRLARYYRRIGSGYWSVGENLAYGCPDLTVAEAMDMWMHSAGHRANILHAAWTEVGVSIVHVDSAPGEYEGDPTTIMTVDFGVRH